MTRPPRGPIVIVTDRPDHPTLAAYAALVRAEGRHALFLAPDTDAEPPPDSAVCLLKSRTPQALTIARQARASGARVVNTPEATAACLDRAHMADRARAAGLPFPRTYAMESPHGRLPEGINSNGPWIMKTRRSHRGEPTPVTGTAAQLPVRAADWPDEPVVVQQFIESDDNEKDWDHKLWVIGDQIFAGLRRSPLTTPAAHGPKHTVPIPDHAIPPLHRELARTAGESFDLDVYGVDLIRTAQGPCIVDINAFPGFRSLRGAAAALARFTTQ